MNYGSSAHQETSGTLLIAHYSKYGPALATTWRGSANGKKRAVHDRVNGKKCSALACRFATECVNYHAVIVYQGPPLALTRLRERVYGGTRYPRRSQGKCCSDLFASCLKSEASLSVQPASYWQRLPSDDSAHQAKRSLANEQPLSTDARTHKLLVQLVSKLLSHTFNWWLIFFLTWTHDCF